MIRKAFLPFLPLAGWIALFGTAALGLEAPGFDDHPGQLYRVWLVATEGAAPWRWHDGWWAGYPELQFYPPAFAYAGAALVRLSLGALDVDAAYHVLVWLAWAAPGVTSYLLLTRVLGSGVAALPGAFVTLTLSAGLASGVEGGVHVGMIAARLGWSMLPLLLFILTRAVAEPARTATLVIPVIAALALTHPAHVPAAAAAVLLAAVGERGGRAQRLGVAVRTLAGAAALTAFWSVPLVARLAETRALAWGSLGELLAVLLRQPLALVLVLLAALAFALCRQPGERLVARFAWVAVGLVAVDALALEPLGLQWLPADRLLDSAALGIALAGGVATGRVIQTMAARPRVPAAAGALLALLVLVALALPGSTLTLWPRRAEWPTLRSIERGLRLPELWARLRGAPEGRVLFVRSGVPLVYGGDWWRPHTHVTALVPRRTGRAIVHGTFTHPSPLAAVVYRGDAERAPIAALAERLDGRSLFGRELATLDAATFDRYADTLGVSAVVALDEDVPALRVFDAHERFRPAAASPPFVIWIRAEGIPIPRRVGDAHWRVDARGEAGRWTTMRVAYSPLWGAFDGETALATRRGRLGDLEVRLAHAAAPIELVYTIGSVERAGVAISALALIVWAASVGLAVRRRRQSLSAQSP